MHESPRFNPQTEDESLIADLDRCGGVGKTGDDGLREIAPWATNRMMQALCEGGIVRKDRESFQELLARLGLKPPSREIEDFVMPARLRTPRDVGEAGLSERSMPRTYGTRAV
mgnify:CR=1 FL=1